MLELSYTSLSNFMRCPRLWGLHYQERLRPVPRYQARPLAFGSAMHTAQEAVWQNRTSAEVLQAWETASATLSQDDRILGDVLLTGYQAWWSEDHSQYRVCQPLTEARVDVPLVDLAGNVVPGVRFRGILDAVAIRRDGINVPVEHKCTQSNITDGSKYWQRLSLNAQAAAYLLLCSWAHRPSDFVLWDVIRIPPYERHKATEPHARKYRKDGGLYNRQRESDETPDEFRARIEAQVLEDPQAFFARTELYMTPDQLHQAHLDILDTVALIQAAIRGDHYPRNTSSCFDYNSRCSYLPLCTGETGPDNTTLYQISKEAKDVVALEDL